MVFSNILLFYFLSSTSSAYHCHNPKRITFLTKRRVNFALLKFKDSFQNLLNPLCTCGLHEESTSHFPLHCPSFAAERSAFLSKIREFDSDLLNYIDSALTHASLFGKTSFNKVTNLLVCMQHLISFYPP